MEKNSIDNPTDPLYPLRVAAELTGTSIYALRQYVDLGLIIPFKTPTNRRLYSKVDIKRIDESKESSEIALDVEFIDVESLVKSKGALSGLGDIEFSFIERH